MLTKAEINRRAWKQVYAIIQSHIDSDSEFEQKDERERALVVKRLDEIAQTAFERSKNRTAKSARKAAQ